MIHINIFEFLNFNSQRNTIEKSFKNLNFFFIIDLYRVSKNIGDSII